VPNFGSITSFDDFLFSSCFGKLFMISAIMGTVYICIGINVYKCSQREMSVLQQLSKCRKLKIF